MRDAHFLSRKHDYIYKSNRRSKLFLANIALLQFLTRPFVVGDRIELKTTGGGTVLIGIVENIDPMRTVLRTDSNVPVAVPNKAITEYIVANESRLGRSVVLAEFQVSCAADVRFRVSGDTVRSMSAIARVCKTPLSGRTFLKGVTDRGCSSPDKPSFIYSF